MSSAAIFVGALRVKSAQIADISDNNSDNFDIIPALDNTTFTLYILISTNFYSEMDFPTTDSKEYEGTFL